MPTPKTARDESTTVTRIRDTAAQDVAHGERPRRPWGLALLGLALIAAAFVVWPALSRWTGSELAVPRERLRLSQVTRATFEREVAVRATVVAAVSPTLYAPADGIVSLHVDAGDLVSVGDALATIASPQLKNRLALERSTLASMNTALERQRLEKRRQELRNTQSEDLARVAVVAAERELRRAEAAWAERVIKQQDLDKARDDVEAARLTHEHARENAKLESESMAFEYSAAALDRDRQQITLTDLERQLADLEIRSPVMGMVGTVAIQERQAVTTNTALVTVVDLTAYEIEMVVPESYADDLSIGLSAQVEVGSDQYPGRVTAVSPEVRDGQVRGRVRFSEAAPEGLRQNQRVSVRVQLESRPDALVVRRGPFYDDGGGRIAYVVEGDVARQRPIRTGAVSIDQVEILEGLTVGEQIVISSFEQFRGADTVLLTN